MITTASHTSAATPITANDYHNHSQPRVKKQSSLRTFTPQHDRIRGKKPTGTSLKKRRMSTGSEVLATLRPSDNVSVFKNLDKETQQQLKTFALLQKNKAYKTGTQGYKPGDYIKYQGAFGVKRAQHAGVYLGQYFGVPIIANFSGGAKPGSISGMVKLDLLANFKATARKNKSPVFINTLKTTRQPHEIVQAAVSELGRTDYDPVNNNCQHYANRAITGISRSEQVEEIINITKKSIETPVKKGIKKLIDKKIAVSTAPYSYSGQLATSALKESISGKVANLVAKYISDGVVSIAKSTSAKLSKAIETQSSPVINHLLGAVKLFV